MPSEFRPRSTAGSAGSTEGDLPKLFRDADRGDPGEAKGAALEADLMTAFEARPTPKPRGWGFGWRRPAIVGGLSLAAALGACALPAEYEVDLGHRIGILVDADKQHEVDVEEIVDHVERSYDLGEIQVAVRLEQHRIDETGESHGEMRIQIDLLGRGLDTEEIWDDLVDQFPELDGGRLEEEALEGIVQGTLGGKWSHEMLDLMIDRDGVEAAKAQILSDLAARGIEGDATVDIQVDDDNGRKRVEVRVEARDEKVLDGEP